MGGAEADTIDGGAGNNTLSFAGAQSEVSVFLVDSVGDRGDAGGDVYVNIQNVTGSAFGDRLFGDGAANVLNGAGGNDFLSGREGDDTFIFSKGQDEVAGGDGTDQIIFGGDFADYVFTPYGTFGNGLTYLTDVEGNSVSFGFDVETLVFADLTMAVNGLYLNT